jgi:hypothetical protein
MDLPADDLAFLRDLVKASRQRTQVVAWIDRDGSKRQTALTAVEAKRLNGLAQSRGIATAELLRQAAHIPVAPPGRTELAGG